MGQAGNDTLTLDEANGALPRAQLFGGDGSDTIEGQDGADRLLFNGSAANEIFETSANGQRVRFTRNVGNIVMDLNDVERVDLNTLGGADTITINNLAGTDLTVVNANLAASGGGGDGQPDNVTVNGTNGDDTVTLTSSDAYVSVQGLRATVNVTLLESARDRVTINALGGSDLVVVNDLSTTDVTWVQLAMSGTNGGSTGDGQPDSVVVNGTAGSDVGLVSGSTAGVRVQVRSTTVTITGSEAANDRLTLNLLAGADSLDASRLIAGLIALTGNGGAGADVLIGSAGADVLSGGDGDDVLLGGPGTDVLDRGSGQNIVIQD